MAGHCRGPVWRSDDFSRCIQHEYLQALFPLVSCGVSLLYLAYQITRATQKSTRAGAEYSPLKQDAGQANGTYHDSDEEDDTDEEEDELRRSQDVALELAKTKASVVELDRPRGELVIAIVEEVAVLGILGIQVAALILQTWGRKGEAAAQASVLVWAYIAILASLRLLLSTTSKWSFRSLWYHTFFLYGFQWICVIVQFRSQIIHPRSRTAAALTSAYFALTTVLALISLTSRKGNRAVELEYEGSLEPSREPLASVFALATFSWVDPIVWTGYKKTYEMKDVWNLMPKDKAAAILRDYRQVKKTNILAWHLLGYFKRSLLVQAAWAAMSGVITFVPTLLLKVILEYIEDPLATPRNAAWLYVILLFVSGILNALSTGQALWIGRKICIRLRAIIIGEIYAKALRRRAGAAPDKVLGQGEKKDDNENKQSIVKRLTSFGRKKKAKSDDAKVPAAKTSEPVDESQVTSGAIINLMAVDSFKVAEISSYLHFLWAETPVQFVLAIALLYLYLGTSSFVGIGMMGLLFPVNMYIAKQFTSVQKKILAATDARIHVTNEVLTNVRIIKYFAWEQRFLASVDEKRVVEMKHLRNRFIVWSAAATIWSGAPVLITFFTFMFYTLVEKKDLVPSVAFTALSLFSLLRIPLDQLADMVAHVQESKVSVDRIEEYLNEPETDKYVQLQGHEHDEDGEPLIGFEQGTFSWGGKDDDDFKMIDLDMNFKVGQLNVIVGPTGSGKTSMLMALLGEMKLLAGHVHLPGGRSREDLKRDPNTGLTEGVAYCAQQAWLVNGTVKDNIVFASKWDARRYKDVIVACSLQRDLEILDSGDQTLVGEKGVTLSGGQKQRISLARALYCDARHVLMDDVLSAVDSHTAKWIFDKALMGPLMYNRTCILVTHNAVLALPHAEFAVVLENGRVTAQGSASEVIGSGKLAEDITKFPSAPPSRPASVLPSRVPPELAHDEDEVPIEPNGTAHGQMSRRNTETNGAPFGDPLTSAISKDIPGMNKSADTETKATGAVKLSIILMYLRYMGGTFYWIIAALCFALQQVSQVATNVWIREWANSYTKTESTLSMTGIHTSPVTHVRGGISTSFNCLRSGSCNWNIPFWTKQAEDLSSFKVVNSDVDISYYLGVYAALGLAYMLITLLREGVLFGGSLMASTRIHRQLMTRVTHAKFRFFDTTPLGQIMNRFSKDIEALDQEVAPVAVGVVHCLFSILTIVILISVITPAFLIAAVFITLIYIAIGKVYINASRDLKRLESVQRSPLYQQFGETLSGMTTIRAYGDERRFIRDNLNQVNTHSRPFIFLWASNRWLSFRVDFVGALVAFLTGAFVISGVGKIDAGAAGLAMTYAVTFTENVLWFVRLYATNEQNMNAVERVKEYLDVDQEADSIIEDKRPEANWPSKGSVEFIDYSTRYRSDFDFVLKNISFKILPGEKVGVVGRTGAGKSSLALALFRALEAEKGTILIDDVDISQIGLQDLRENIVMVPQDPTLFTGTIRSNLDPFGLFTDEEIFTALRGVQLVGSATSTAPSRAPSPPRTPVTQSHKQSPNGKTAVAFTRELASTSESSSPIETSTMENKNIFRNLSSPVAESGSNLSQGQRQLLCLARAMLKAPKVLLMDEATASIDYATDSKIQETIREIKNTTITIAHRLQTIIDYDKVLVLDKGEVVEYGDPYDLISRTDGIFHGMCEMTGDLDVLVKDAKKAHDGRKLVDDQ